MIERMPGMVGYVTLAAGVALVVRPELATGPLRLEDQATAMRLVGLSDLVLVPGLLRGEPRWPWMAARAALNLMDAAYLRLVGHRRGAALFVGLTAVDGFTALALRRA